MALAANADAITVDGSGVGSRSGSLCQRVRQGKAAQGAPDGTEAGALAREQGGNVSSHPYSCALRAGASYNYLLVDGERRLTPRECLRLQGFPDSFRIVCSASQTRKQTGNAVPVPMIRAVIKEIINAVVKPSRSSSKKGSQAQEKTVGAWKAA